MMMKMYDLPIYFSFNHSVQKILIELDIY